MNFNPLNAAHWYEAICTLAIIGGILYLTGAYVLVFFLAGYALMLLPLVYIIMYGHHPDEDPVVERMRFNTMVVSALVTFVLWAWLSTWLYDYINHC